MIRNILFDWSGTLVDDLPAVWQATNHVFRQAGLAELSLDRFRAEFSLPFQAFYDRYAPDVPMARLEEWFHGSFREAQQSVAPLPHALDFLEFCQRRNLRCFVLSATHTEHFEGQAKSTGFGRFFDRAYLGVWDKRDKIREILSENALAPEETLFVGDMAHDIETARHGGLFSCGVLTGYNDLTQLRAAAPDLVTQHLGELRRLLESHDLDIDSVLASETSGTYPIPTAGGLVYDSEDRVLMVRTRKWSRLWGIPGGKLKWGEAAADALRREIKEETGLSVDHVRLVMVQDCVFPPEFYRKAHFILLNYTCRATAGEVKLNDEAEDFRWATLAEARDMPLNQPTRLLLDRIGAGKLEGLD